MTHRVLLLTCFYLTTSLYYSGLYQGIKVGPISLLGWFLPSTLMVNPLALQASGLLFLVTGVLWLFGRGVPWSSWLATISFTVFMSLYVENVPFWDHQMNLANQLLWVFCFYHHFYPEGKERPVWLHPMFLFCIVSGYAMSGLAKLVQCGWGWADGISLQLWVWSIGYPERASWLMESRELASWLQVAVLWLELSLPLCFWLKPYRVVAGLGLIAFHLLSFYLFQYINFVGNAVLLAVFLVGYDWLETPQEAKVEGP